MIRTCPVCHEPCLWPDTLCACCRRYSTDPHHACEATILLERWAAAMQPCECSVGECSHDHTFATAVLAINEYVARRREAQGGKDVNTEIHEPDDCMCGVPGSCGCWCHKEPSESDGARAIALLVELDAAWDEFRRTHNDDDTGAFYGATVRLHCAERAARAFVQARREKGTNDASD